MAMLIDDHKQIAIRLLRDGESFLRQTGDTEKSNQVHQLLTDTEQRDSPTIMFYGLYNAGKSTLINALCQKVAVRTGDIPTTTEIEEVPWDGFTILDTPGINARDEHTRIAMKEIHRSDLVLFVVDNSDTFDNAFVYQAISRILQTGKALAVVINQKNIDEEEDPNIPTAEQPSMQKIMYKMIVNLSEQGRKIGVAIQDKKNFLGRFAVNAQTAFDASECEPEDRALLLRVSSISELVNAIHEVMRHAAPVFRLQTPLFTLREILREAEKAYGDPAVYGDQKQLAEQREEYLTSRKRMREILLSSGLRKIDAAMERAKIAAVDGQYMDSIGGELEQELQQVLREAAASEQAMLNQPIRLSGAPGGSRADSAAGDAKADEDGLFDTLDSLMEPALRLGGESLGKGLISTTVAKPEIPINLILDVVDVIVRIINRAQREQQKALKQAEESKAQMAAYYRYLNQLRDFEASAKATWERTIGSLIQSYYDPKIAQLDEALSRVSGECAAHTRKLQELQKLQSRVDEELRALDAAC